jgi:hypothetical protein
MKIMWFAVVFLSSCGSCFATMRLPVAAGNPRISIIPSAFPQKKTGTK